jgi:hypothetical protein
MKENGMKKKTNILSGMMNRFLLQWAALFGLFVSTSNCPFCGQPASVCPAAAGGMGILAGIVSGLNAVFRRRTPQSENISKSNANRR